jgi:hypothetical protein
MSFVSPSSRAILRHRNPDPQALSPTLPSSRRPSSKSLLAASARGQKLGRKARARHHEYKQA